MHISVDIVLYTGISNLFTVSARYFTKSSIFSFYLSAYTLDITLSYKLESIKISLTFNDLIVTLTINNFTSFR
jgi:hypothetical protein